MSSEVKSRSRADSNSMVSMLGVGVAGLLSQERSPRRGQDLSTEDLEVAAYLYALVVGLRITLF